MGGVMQRRRLLTERYDEEESQRIKIMQEWEDLGVLGNLVGKGEEWLPVAVRHYATNIILAETGDMGKY